MAEQRAPKQRHDKARDWTSCSGRHAFVCWPCADRGRARPCAAPFPPSPPQPRSRRRRAAQRRPSRLCGGRQFRPDGAGRCAGIARHLRHCTASVSSSCSPAVPPASTDLAGGYEDDMTSWRAGRLPVPASCKGDCLICDFRQRLDALCARRRSTRRAQRGAKIIAIANNPARRCLQAGRRRHPAANAAGSDRRLDPHGRRHGAEDRAQHAVDADRHPSRPCP